MCQHGINPINSLSFLLDTEKGCKKDTTTTCNFSILAFSISLEGLIALFQDGSVKSARVKNTHRSPLNGRFFFLLVKYHLPVGNEIYKFNLLPDRQCLDIKDSDVDRQDIVILAFWVQAAVERNDSTLNIATWRTSLACLKEADGNAVG